MLSNEKKVFLGNAFSLQMLDADVSNTVTVTPVTAEEVASSNFESCIGHADTANVVGNILGREVECNRVSVKLTQGDILYVAQVVGGRLPEGATTLPEGFQMKFLKVELA